MRFLFDNNFAPAHSTMLRSYGVDASALREHFPRDIKDIDLFHSLREHDWIFVTADMAIQRRHLEAQALRECGASAIFLEKFWTKYDLWFQGRWLLTHWQAIEAKIADLNPPIYLQVASNGSIKRILI